MLARTFVTHAELITGKPAAADDPLLSRHAEQAELLECPDQDEAYFDVIMRVRHSRPVRRLHPLYN